MALRPLLTTAERDQGLEIPIGTEGVAADYTLGETDMSLIRQHRGDVNRLDFAIHLCLLRHPGIALAEDTEVPPELVSWLATRLGIPAQAWDEYGTRGETRQEHGREIRAYLGMTAFGITDFRQLVEHVGEVAVQTDKGLVLVEKARDFLQSRKVASPGIGIIERACAQRLTKRTGESTRRCATTSHPNTEAGSTFGTVQAWTLVTPASRQQNKTLRGSWPPRHSSRINPRG